MPLDASAVGRSLPAIEVDVERGRLRAFAHAIGCTDPVYVDVEAARAAGHPDLPVPPTFLFGLDLDRPEPFGWLRDLGADLGRMLHGEQRFAYDALAHAGDTLTLASTITDVYAKKGGALDFVERRTEVTRAGAPVAILHQVVIIPAGGA